MTNKEAIEELQQSGLAGNQVHEETIIIITLILLIIAILYFAYPYIQGLWVIFGGRA